jgi:tRNA modification GTPase
LASKDLGELLKVLGFEAIPELAQVAVDNIHLLVNKIDLVEVPEQPEHAWPVSYVSAKTGVGLQAFTKSLVEQSLGGVEGTAFTARLRHVQSLELVQGLLLDAKQGFSDGVGAELIAEDCQLAHQALGQIVGTVSADDLLGEIFSSFCIGK